MRTPQHKGGHCCPPLRFAHSDNYLDFLAAGFFAGAFFLPESSFLPLTADLSTAPALKAARLPAGIWIFARVLGFVPVRAAVWRTSNVPKPVSVTFSPFLRVS